MGQSATYPRFESRKRREQMRTLRRYIEQRERTADERQHDAAILVVFVAIYVIVALLGLSFAVASL